MKQILFRGKRFHVIFSFFIFLTCSSFFLLGYNLGEKSSDKKHKINNFINNVKKQKKHLTDTIFFIDTIMIQELKDRKLMLLQEAKRIKDTLLTRTSITKHGVSSFYADKQIKEAIHLPLEYIYSEILSIDKKMAELYDPKPIGIEKEFFYKKQANEIL